MSCKTAFLGILAAISIPLYGTALDDYVAVPDPAYTWQQVGSGSSAWFTTAYTLDLISQQWRSESEVEPTLVEWKHWVNVVIPSLGSGNTALILINGGDTLDPAPVVTDQYRQLAFGTGSIIVELTAVPNQPLHFLDESFSRSEDEIIAYSWDKFL